MSNPRPRVLAHGTNVALSPSPYSTTSGKMGKPGNIGFFVPLGPKNIYIIENTAAINNGTVTIYPNVLYVL